jgi:hypothetical protein
MVEGEVATAEVAAPTDAEMGVVTGMPLAILATSLASSASAAVGLRGSTAPVHLKPMLLGRWGWPSTTNPGPVPS